MEFLKYRASGSTILGLCLISFLFLTPGASAKNDSNGIPAVIQKLDEIRRMLDENAEEVAVLKSQVANIQANALPCTLQRFRDRECGPDNHPLDLTVSICGSLAADGSFSTKYAFSGSLDIQAGAGWKDAPDVHIVENFQAPPGIPLLTPTLPPIPVGWITLPSEVAATLQAAASLGMDACIDDIRLPIGKSISEPAVIALLEGLETAGMAIHTTLSDQLGTGSGNSTAGLTATRSSIYDAESRLEALNTALMKVAELSEIELSSSNTDPLNAFKNGPLRELADTLPIGGRLQAILDEPGQLALPGLQDAHTTSAQTSSTAGGTSLNYAGLAGNLCTSLTSDDSSLRTISGPVCNFVESVGSALPTLDDVLAIIANINLLPDVPGAIKAVMQPLFSGAGDVVAETSNLFCSSRLGNRAIFDSLCGR